MRLRHFLQVFVMLGDVALILASVAVLYHWGSFALLFVVPALIIWYRQGAFEAWQPATIRQFLRNAKKLGM